MNRRSSDEAEDEDHGITGGSWCRHRQGGFSPRWLGHRWDNRVSPEDQAVEPQRCVRAAATVRRWHGGLPERTFVSRTLRALGHEPRIIPAIYTKPFVKGQKNDYNDAEAVAEAALRPNLRLVQGIVKQTQQDLLGGLILLCLFDRVFSRDSFVHYIIV
jgi:hypothetical protein